MTHTLILFIAHVLHLNIHFIPKKEFFKVFFIV